MNHWLFSGLEDDIRPRMFAAADEGLSFALATIVTADGGPRPVGAQMVVTETDSWGFLSGGCIEADVARNGREVIRDGRVRTLVYGKGSPFIDIRLPCGGRIEVAIERVEPGDPALEELRRCTAGRRSAIWVSDGTNRRCEAREDSAPFADGTIFRRYDPEQRLVVVGTDPFAMAIAGLGKTIGWQTILLSPFGPSTGHPWGISHDRRPLRESMEDLGLDRWTAVAVATHDLEIDQEALAPALHSRAGYVGVLGSRRKLDQRRAGLRDAGVGEADIDRLHAPIGLAIDAHSPWEVAVSVIAEIIESGRQSMPAQAREMTQGAHVAA